MKAWRALRTLSSFPLKPHFNLRLYSAQPLQIRNELDNESDSDSSVFDSSHYAVAVPTLEKKEPTWNEKYRERADRVVFGKETQKGELRIFHEEEDERKNRALARALLQAALDREEEKEEEVKEEDQKSLSVGIIGAPNAGKSALTNYLIGTKVAAVSRKTNTTTHEVFGVMTKGNIQICFFDTPGLMLKKSGQPYKDINVRVESAWSSVNLFEVLMVIFDAHRHLNRPDLRVVRLIERLGAQIHPTQKRVLCVNKVDLVGKKKDLLKVVEQFQNLPGYERQFKDLGLKIHYP